MNSDVALLEIELDPPPSVSWLLCTHVVNEQLRLALDSCLAQTFSDFELIVVANGPSHAEIVNATREWCGGDSRLRVFSTEVRHLNFSLNLGLHFARGELVARMDGDDLSCPERLAHQVTFMHEHPDVVVLGTNYELVDEGGQRRGTVSLPTSDARIRRAMLKGNPLCHPSVIFRRAPVLAAGGYLGGLYAEDYDLWTRLALNKANRFANLPEICLSYRTVGSGPARRSRHAYAAVAASQWRNFVLGAGLAWGVAAAITLSKAIARSPPMRRLD